MLRGIGRALFRGSRSYSRQVAAAQQIDVPSLQEVSEKGRKERGQERAEASTIQCGSINLALLFITCHLSSLPSASSSLFCQHPGCRARGGHFLLIFSQQSNEIKPRSRTRFLWFMRIFGELLRIIEANMASKQPRRSDLTSNIKSVTPITYIFICILLLWYRPF